MHSHFGDGEPRMLASRGYRDRPVVGAQFGNNRTPLADTRQDSRYSGEHDSRPMCGARSGNTGVPRRFNGLEAAQASALRCRREATFSRGYPNLMRSYGGLLEPTGSSLTSLKSTFNAEHFIRRLSWSILNGCGAIHS